MTLEISPGAVERGRSEDPLGQTAHHVVVGVGGGGGNAVNHMLRSNIEGVEFICANTDAQALKNTEVRTALQLGSNITRGLGAGGNPEIGRRAAQEDEESLRAALEGAETDRVRIRHVIGGGEASYWIERDQITNIRLAN